MRINERQIKKEQKKSMSEWKEYKLGDLYDVHNGLSKGRKFFGSGYPFLSFKTVFNNYFLPPKLSELVQANEKEQKGYNIKRGDVFVTRTSETPEELGMSSVALKDYPFATYNGFTKRLRPKDMSLVCPEFIGYYLRSPKFRALFYGLASSMSTRASLVNGDLLGMSVFLPSFETQERIASLLSSLDDKISVNKKICENLEAQAQALFKHWFIDFAPFKNGKFVESELGMIPEGWRVGTLGEIADITMGQSPSGSSYNENGNGVVFYQGRAEFGYRFPKVRLFTTEPKRFTEPLSTLLSVRAPVGDINVATEKCCIGRGLAAIKSKSYHSSYILYLLKSLRRRFDVYNGEGTVFGSINKDTLNGLNIVIPPNSAIREFNDIVQVSDSEILESHNEDIRLQALRDTLLPRLMSGQIKL